MRVEVYSDIICPWCRAGRRRFERAVDQLGWDDVELVHRPFELVRKPDQPPRPTTFDAHRLLEWALDAHGVAVQGRLEQRLLDAWHDDREDIGDHAVLARLAGDAGLDAAEAATVLADGRYDEEVRAWEAEAERLDIYGVPTFVLGGALAIPGAQDADTFASLLTRYRARNPDA